MMNIGKKKKLLIVVLVVALVACSLVIYNVYRTWGVSDFFIEAFTPFFESGGEGYTVRSHQGIDITEQFYNDNVGAFRIGNWRYISKNADKYVGQLTSG